MRFRLFAFLLLVSVPSLADDSYLTHLYQEAATAWEKGDVQSAVNSWMKYIEVASRLDNPTSQLDEVKDRYNQGREKIKKPIIVSQPIDDPRPATPPAFVVPKKSSPIIMERLLARAQSAEKAGLYEEARRLYRLAAKSDAKSEGLKAKLEELDKLLE